jgi:hypothetical protein
MAQIFDVFLNDLRSTKKNFNRLFTIGLIFTLFGYFYIIEPYFRYKAEEKNSAQKLAEKQIQLKDLSTKLSQMDETSRKIYSSLQGIRERIQEFPDHLQEMLSRIDNIGSSTPSASRIQNQLDLPEDNRSAGISFPLEVNTFEGRVRWYTKNWFSQVITELEESVINPVLKLKYVEETSSENKLDSLSKEAIQSINKYVDEVDPDFWHSYSGGKVPVAEGLNNIVAESFNPIYTEIELLIEDIRGSKDIREKEILNAENAIVEYQERIKTLESRIKSIESPIGKIPLSLTDFAEVFPLLIVILIVTLTTSLNKSIRLSNDIWREIEKGNVDEYKKDVHYLVDCWYLSPYQNTIQPVLLGLSAFVVIGIFIRSVLIVIVNPEMFVSITGEAESLRKFLFVSFYTIGNLVVIACLWSVKKRLYLKEQE